MPKGNNKLPVLSLQKVNICLRRVVLLSVKEVETATKELGNLLVGQESGKALPVEALMKQYQILSQ